MKLTEIIQQLEALAPPKYQESYDNSGLLIGNKEMDISSAMICLDSIEEVLDEAIAKGCNLIIAHHPILFSGIKKINGSNYIERVILKAIKNDLAIYAIHTNLDNVFQGVNHKIAEKIGLKNLEILQPKAEKLKKLVFYAPVKQVESIKSALFKLGAGSIGNYDSCSFKVEGEGSFRANDQANPHVGKLGQMHREPECRVEMLYPIHLENKLILALLDAHPYEEVAYDLFPITNKWNKLGSGMIGDLPESIEGMKFLKSLKSSLAVELIRHTEMHKEKVKKIALCGGSGSFLLQEAIAKNADVFISADFKYHQFFDADGRICIADVGHFESEQFTMELIQEYLQEKIPNFATYLTSIRTNPINYI